MNFEMIIRTAFDNFIRANGGFKCMEDNLKSYMEEAIEEGDDLSCTAEVFCNDLDAFEGYLQETINDIISAAKINVTVEF